MHYNLRLSAMIFFFLTPTAFLVLPAVLVQVPEGKTVKGIARGIGKVIKNMKLTNIEVYVTTDDEVALYRK